MLNVVMTVIPNAQKSMMNENGGNGFKGVHSCCLADVLPRVHFFVNMIENETNLSRVLRDDPFSRSTKNGGSHNEDHNCSNATTSSIGIPQ